jgi:hypothetical protein
MFRMTIILNRFLHFGRNDVFLLRVDFFRRIQTSYRVPDPSTTVGMTLGEDNHFGRGIK